MGHLNENGRFAGLGWERGDGGNVGVRWKNLFDRAMNSLSHLNECQLGIEIFDATINNPSD